MTKNHLLSQYNQIYSLLQQTINQNINNSVLLQGPRGTLKKKTLEQVLLDTSKKHTFYTVFLNGIYQTDAKQCLMEIQKQLQINIELNYTFSECLSLIIDIFKQASKSTCPIVFILNEMDLFTNHSKQLLLYNLFDLVHSELPVFIVGITSKTDLLLMMEKRVKSRFSHRIIDFYPITDLNDFILMIKESLLIDLVDNNDSNQSLLVHNNDSNKSLLVHNNDKMNDPITIDKSTSLTSNYKKREFMGFDIEEYNESINVKIQLTRILLMMN
jgi:origin recognition complex subunit 4